ncbi:hypothetical protein GGR57DRAFT_230251 [Xylariaceae sp. FL1272]|nr:hypothetical protein GGR57DRAFT_230251 [Xylariaceae sp. FL1272]
MAAASRFASLEELLLILLDYVDDRRTLWSLCLSNRRLNRIFTAKLYDPLLVRFEPNEDQDGAQRVLENLFEWPHLSSVRRLQLDVNNGPEFPERTLGMIEKLLSHLPALKIFGWGSTHGDIPDRVVLSLASSCPQLEELHFLCGPEVNKSITDQRFNDGDELFRNVHTLTAKSIAFENLRRIMGSCRNLSFIEATHLKRTIPMGTLYFYEQEHLKLNILQEEAKRAETRAPLKMRLCFSRGATMTHWCQVCEMALKPQSSSLLHPIPSDRYNECWSWAIGRARQFHSTDNLVRHLEYTYPPPQKPELSQLGWPELPEHDPGDLNHSGLTH